MQALSIAAPPRRRLDDGPSEPDVIAVIEPQAPATFRTLTLIASFWSVCRPPLVELAL